MQEVGQLTHNNVNYFTGHKNKLADMLSINPFRRATVGKHNLFRVAGGYVGGHVYLKPHFPVERHGECQAFFDEHILIYRRPHFIG